MLHTAKIIDVRQQASKLGMGSQQFSNRSVHTIRTPALSVKSNDGNAARTEIIQNPSQVDNQTDLRSGFENITHPKVCVWQWRQELITIEEALNCIDKYMEKVKSSNSTSEKTGEE
jgi:hypothetical protein